MFNFLLKTFQMPKYVKIFDMFQQREKVMSEGVALNRLQFAHFKNGGRWCAMNEVNFYNTPPPEPKIKEVDVREKYQLEEVNIDEVQSLPDGPPSPEDVEAAPAVDTEQTVSAKKPKSKARKVATKRGRQPKSK